MVDIVVIGASAGAVPVLKTIIGNLPAEFAGSIFIVVHLPPYYESKMPEILSKASRLPVVHPADGEAIEPGMVYVAPNDHHFIIQEGKMQVKNGPKENHFRPSIDALFRSAAYAYKERVAGIILSGSLNDGTSGLWTIKQMNGIAIVQDPEDAEHTQLPLNAIEYTKADYIL